MAQGQRSFTTEGKTAVRYDFTPFEAGDYDLKLLDKIEIRKKNEPGSMPRVSVQFQALGTASTEGGKDRILFHDFYVKLTPGKDGVPMPDRADQINGYSQALGTKFTTGQIIDVPGPGGAMVECIHPGAVKQWLQAHVGSVVRGRVKIEAGTGGYKDKNRLDYFILPEEMEGAGGSPDFEAAPAEEALALESSGDEFALPTEEPTFEEAPETAPPPAPKAAPKNAAPAPKVPHLASPRRPAPKPQQRRGR